MSEANPKKERNFNDLKDLCGESREAGISTLILCYTDEWGPKQLKDHAVYCGPRCEMLVLAYHEGCIWRCELEGEAAERSTVQELVSSYGLKWEERSRNNAKYGS